METNKKSRWYGPKQIHIMLYTAVIFLIGTSIIGGNNNTVFPMFAGAATYYNGGTYVFDPDFTSEMGQNGFAINYGYPGTWIYYKQRRVD